MGELSAIRSGIRSALITNQLSLLVPNSTASAVVGPSSATQPTTGISAWTQLASSGVLSGHALTGIVLTPTAAGDTTLEVGSGAAGAEVVRHRCQSLMSDNFRDGFVPVIPAVTFPTNERAACRMVSTTTSLTVRVYLQFTPTVF